MFQKIKHSLIARIVILSALGTLIASTAVIMATTWIFERSLETQLDNHLSAYAGVFAGAIRVEDGEVFVEDNPVLQAIPRHWQIDMEEKHIARSSRLKEALPLLKPVTFYPQRVENDNVIAIQQGFEFPGGHRLILTFGLDRQVAEAYKAQLQNQFNRNVYKSLSIVLIVLVVIGFIQTVVISWPLKKAKQAVQDVREGRQSRIAGARPSEIQVLSDEINYLLDYTQGVIKRHRIFSGNLAHTLKTPLTVIRNETDSALVREQVEDMLQVIDRNLSKAQSAGTHNILSAQTKIKPVIERIVSGFGKLYYKEIEVQCSYEVMFRGDEADLYEILGNLIENACKFGHSHVRVIVSDAHITVEDDGPGIPPEHYDTVLNRGLRLDETKDGAGLGLSITKDIVGLYGGKITLNVSELGGLKTSILLSQNDKERVS